MVTPLDRRGEAPKTAVIVAVSPARDGSAVQTFSLNLFDIDEYQRDSDGQLDPYFTALLFWTDLVESMLAQGAERLRGAQANAQLRM